MPQAELLLEKGVTKVIKIHSKHSINQFYIGEKYANILLTNVRQCLIPFMQKAVLHLLG